MLQTLANSSFQAMSRRELLIQMDSNPTPRARDLSGFAFRGLSLGLPTIVEKLTWKTFAKVIVQTPEGTSGFNLRIEQRHRQLGDGLRPRTQKPRFGEFDVCESDGFLVLDYSGRNRMWSPLHRVRDRIVMIDEDRFLGETRLAVGRATISTPSFFLLQRATPINPTVDFSTAHHNLSEI